MSKHRLIISYFLLLIFGSWCFSVFHCSVSCCFMLFYCCFMLFHYCFMLFIAVSLLFLGVSLLCFIAVSLVFHALSLLFHCCFKVFHCSVSRCFKVFHCPVSSCCISINSCSGNEPLRFFGITLSAISQRIDSQ